MRKIPTLFKREWETSRLVCDEVAVDAEWVLAGEGIATRKWDGTACLIRDGKLFKRYEAKKGRPAPVDFEPVGEEDPETGKRVGWVPVGDGPEDRWHREGLAHLERTMFSLGFPVEEGTYELIGPKVQGNPEAAEVHVLVLHGGLELPDAPRDFAPLKAYLAEHDIEGIVWHHPDGRMVKIKGKDFGIKRPSEVKEVA